MAYAIQNGQKGACLDCRCGPGTGDCATDIVAHCIHWPPTSVDLTPSGTVTPPGGPAGECSDCGFFAGFFFGVPGFVGCVNQKQSGLPRDLVISTACKYAWTRVCTTSKDAGGGFTVDMVVRYTFVAEIAYFGGVPYIWLYVTIVAGLAFSYPGGDPVNLCFETIRTYWSANGGPRSPWMPLSSFACNGPWTLTLAGGATTFDNCWPGWPATITVDAGNAPGPATEAVSDCCTATTTPPTGPPNGGSGGTDPGSPDAINVPCCPRGQQISRTLSCAIINVAGLACLVSSFSIVWNEALKVWVGVNVLCGQFIYLELACLEGQSFRVRLWCNGVKIADQTGNFATASGCNPLDLLWSLGIGGGNACGTGTIEIHIWDPTPP